MTGASSRQATARACVAVALLVSLGGCAWVRSWFHRSPPPAPVAAPVIRDPLSDVDVQPATAARAACANYEQAVQAAPFPRDAIIRGLDAGTARVRFRVAGTTVTVLSVTSSAPPFGDAAADVVRTLDCKVERPTTFDVPFSWRTQR